MARLPSQLTYNDLNGKEAVEILVDWFRHLLSQQPLLQPHLTLPKAKMSLDINVLLEMYTGGTVPVASPPESISIDGFVSLSNEVPGGEDLNLAQLNQQHLSTIINAAPIPGGQPPDQIREQHDLPVPRPSYGPRDTGSHVFLADVEQPADPRASGGREGIVADGYVFSSEPTEKLAIINDQTIELPQGEIKIDMTGNGISHAGMLVKDDTHRKSAKEFGDKRGERYSSVNGVIDAGPAGLMTNRGGGGLGSDGRQRISFGNNNRG